MMKRPMAGSFRNAGLCCGVFLICASLIRPVQDYVQSRSVESGFEPDVLFFSSPSLVKKMALGYDALLADFYWMRTIQYYGRRDEAAKRKIRYKNLYALLDIATTLDPDLFDAYRSGSCFLAEDDPVGAGRPEDALKLLDKGIRAHPLDWRLVHDKGFVYYWYLGDFKAAGEAWLQAAKLPEAPHWLQSLAAVSLSKGGSLEVAIALWQELYRNSTRDNVRENALNHLISFQAARDMWGLEFLAEQYKMLFKSYPPSLAVLVRGQERQYPLVDPLGAPYQYDPAAGKVRLSPDTKVVYLKVPEIYRNSFRKNAASFLP